MTSRRGAFGLGLMVLGIALARPATSEPSEASIAPQAPPASTISSSTDPVAITEERERLTRLYSAIDTEISRLQQQRLELPADISVIQDFLASSEHELERDQKKLEAAEKQSAADSDSIERLTYSRDSSKRTVERYRSDLERVVKLDGSLTAKRAELESTRAQLFKLDRRIADLLNFEENKNEFRKLTSFAFCGLVAVVILGFYFIAFAKGQIAENIFSGEKGIQFITLFLIVIAITLFGIMGILESKELAALLGGLSGYILGRVSS